MKNNYSNTIKNLTITPEEKELVLKLNKKILELVKKTQEYFDQLNTENERSIESAFLISHKDKTFVKEYKELIAELELSSQKVLNVNVDFEFEKAKEISKEKAEDVYSKLKNTFDNFENLFLKNLKNEILIRFQKINEEKNNLIIVQHKKEIVRLLKQMQVLLEDEKLLTSENFRNDYDLLLFLKDNEEPVKKISWKQLILPVGSVLFLLLILMLMVFL